ncbi:MAG TPA: DHA2 family efflux MFS transporter permease subunit [Candidatus Saccharimonadales bacterium]|nr:DHA2 family efflux MFS transporter permease subunit [Candidatus Saccharimonadales bacterium]
MLEKVKHKGLALAVLAAAQFMVVLDATIVNVALPAIKEVLKFTTDAQLQWVVTSYALLFGGFLLLGGRLADLFGRRKMFLAGVIVFAIASLLAGIAQNPLQMITFRGLQGLGGALLAPAALSLVLSIFKEGSERNKALGVWSMVAAGGGAVGLIVGGVLTQYVDWRWIFFINVPIAAAVVAAAIKYVPASKPQDKQRVDVLGALTITGSLMALVYALAKAAEDGWGNRSTIVSFAVAAGLMATFIINELKVRLPLIKLSIFSRRNVTGGTLIQLLMPAAMFGMFFYLSIYLQQILGYTPTETGVANLPFTLTIMLVAGFLSKNAAKVNAKAMLVVGPLIVAAGLMFFARVPIAANYWTDILPGIIMMATGMSIVFVLATLITTSGVSHEESGLVSGLLNTGQQVGGAIGLAVLTVVSTKVTNTEMAKIHGDMSLVPNALVAGFHQGFKVAALFAVGASVIALVVLRSHKTTQKDLDHEAETEAESLAAIPGV